MTAAARKKEVMQLLVIVGEEAAKAKLEVETKYGTGNGASTIINRRAAT